MFSVFVCIVCLWWVSLGAAEKIPLHLIMTGVEDDLKDEPDVTIESVRHTLLENRALKFRWFGDRACEKYIEAHYDREMIHIFTSEHHGPYKGDICRACILYREGGFYMDNDIQLTVPIQTLVNSETTFMSITSIMGGIMQAVIGVTPESEIMKETLEEIRRWYRHPFPSTLPMGPVTMLRGLQGVMKRRCPEESQRTSFCGDAAVNPLPKEKVVPPPSKPAFDFMKLSKYMIPKAIRDKLHSKVTEAENNALALARASGEMEPTPEKVHVPMVIPVPKQPCRITVTPQWSCGSEHIKLFEEATVNCDKQSIECPHERHKIFRLAKAHNQPAPVHLSFGIFEPWDTPKGVEMMHLGWTRFASCTAFECGALLQTETRRGLRGAATRVAGNITGA